jgi:hypothetical protein
MGQREGDSVSNTPTAALVRSVLCGGAPTPSAEMRKVEGWRERGSVLNTVCPQLLLSGQYFVVACLLPLQR